MVTRIMFFAMLFVAANMVSSAQTHPVYGIVTVFDSIPLIGVDVEVKGTKEMAQTDSLGKFVVVCKDRDKIKISAKGFVTQNVKIQPEIKAVAINLKIKPGEEQREYAIGYGYIAEKDRTTAISNLQNKDTDFTKFNDMFDLIRSMGAQVTGQEIILRGTNSMRGSSAALIVVDDAIVDASYLQTLDPKEVKNVNLIRDGSAAVYGSRGTNGVVIVTTKKGGDK